MNNGYCHSRSSSDSENPTLKDLLPAVLEDFLKDFDFSDIYPYLRNSDIFTEEECIKIKNQDTREKQTILLFFILRDHEKMIPEFFDLLRDEYEWLSDSVSNADKLPTKKEFSLYLECIYELRSIYPKHSDFNVHRLDYYCQIRQALFKLKPRNYLVICGELGFGKKWLALDTCCDYYVIKKMGFKIIWLDVHNCDSQERDFEKLQRLKILLGVDEYPKKIGDYEGISNKILEYQQDLRLILKSDQFRNCLLVLADVQNRKTIEAFDLRCKILITTRNKKITEYLPSASCKIIQISNGLSQNECKDLCEKVLTKPVHFPENSIDLFDQSKGHPFLMNIIAQNMKENSSNSNWDRWIENLYNFQIENDKINNIIELSLNILNSDELNLFKTFAIFYHSVQIPFKILANLWAKTDAETTKIIFKFEKFSLINIDYNDDSMTCSLHFLYSSYLKTLQDIDRIDLHRKLIQNYNIESILENETEFDIELPNDDYFHWYIGYHLRAGKMTKLFPKLYLDFRFLGQKLRATGATGLGVTIGDLKYYREEITHNDDYNENLIKSLLEFLPNIEEMIRRSEDTFLMQYALMCDGLVHFEALKQASRYIDKTWFFDGGHFHRSRQMFSLPGKPKFLKLIEAETCLIAMDSNKSHEILLTDTSLGYNYEPTKFIGHDSYIMEVEIVLENYLISLDYKGKVLVWSIADERRRSVTRRQSSRLIVNHRNFATARYRTKTPIHSISRTIDGEAMRVQHFHLDDYSCPGSTYLHLAFQNGDICLYKWVRNRFEAERHIPPMHTKIRNLQFILKLFDRYYMVINNTGSLKVFKISDGSSCCFSFQWPQDTDAPRRVHQIQKENETIVIFVFSMKILQVSFSPQDKNFLSGDLEILYEVPDKKSAISCSCLTVDTDQLYKNRYLIIGTKQGLVIFDLVEKSEVLRNSVSESIVSVDVYSLKDYVYKYVIVSGSEGQKILNIFCLKLTGGDEYGNQGTITWSNGTGSLRKELNLINNPQFEPNAWLIGNDLFDVNFNENHHSLVAVDSKNRIHQMTSDDDDWSIIILSELNNPKITSITTTINGIYYFGCENGKIYNSLEVELPQNGDSRINTSINFLKLFKDNILIASTWNSSTQNNCLIYKDEIIYDQCEISVINIYEIFEKYLILLDKKCAFTIFNLTNKNKLQISNICGSEEGPNEKNLGGSDLKSNLFVLGTLNSWIHVYKFMYDPTKLEEYQINIVKYAVLKRPDTIEITSVAISPNTIHIAIGLKSGLIEIYRQEKRRDELGNYEKSTLSILQRLESHKSPIYHMKFSPWNDLNLPLILASSSEQLCFWDITYILNNPLDHSNANGPKRRSTRFGSSSSAPSPSSSTENNTLKWSSSVDVYKPLEQSPSSNVWLNKKGPSDKPELLSCIKFAGKKAQKFYTNDLFTKFVTIDDEGEYYFLTVQEFSNKEISKIDKNSNSPQIKTNGNNHLNGNVANNNDEDCDEVYI